MGLKLNKNRTLCYRHLRRTIIIPPLSVEPGYTIWDVTVDHSIFNSKVDYVFKYSYMWGISRNAESYFIVEELEIGRKCWCWWQCHMEML